MPLILGRTQGRPAHREPVVAMPVIVVHAVRAFACILPWRPTPRAFNHTRVQRKKPVMALPARPGEETQFIGVTIRDGAPGARRQDERGSGELGHTDT